MAKRPTADVWLSARQQWEADPTHTFESIAKIVGVSRVAVSKRASPEQEGWSRPQSLRQIVEKAQIQADAKVTPKLRDVSAVTGKSTEQAAVDVRADLLESHRKDWMSHRKLFTLDKISADFDEGKKAKISAEMTLLRQKGERQAYGLDDGAAGQEADGRRELSEVERATRLAALLVTLKARQG